MFVDWRLSLACNRLVLFVRTNEVKCIIWRVKVNKKNNSLCTED